VRRLKRAHTRRWTKADNAAWWTARRAALKARGSPTRETCVDGVKLFERFVYCGNCCRSAVLYAAIARSTRAARQKNGRSDRARQRLGL
jgi:hypothetical protein